MKSAGKLGRIILIILAAGGSGGRNGLKSTETTILEHSVC